MTLPTQWRKERQAWFDAVGLEYIMDIQPNGRWDTATLPTGPDSLSCQFGDNGWLLWRTYNAGTLTAAGAIPPDKVIRLTVV